jgi:hypothetical protein
MGKQTGLVRGQKALGGCGFLLPRKAYKFIPTVRQKNI